MSSASVRKSRKASDLGKTKNSDFDLGATDLPDNGADLLKSVSAAQRILKFMEKNNWKMLHFAAYTDWPEETLALLVEALQDGNPKSACYHDLALCLGWPVAVLERILGPTNDHVNHVDKHNRTSLHIAANRDNYRFVRSLLKLKSVNVNCVDAKGLTPLHYAAKQGHGRVITCLCLRNADANIKTPKASGGKTAIHYAAVEGHAHILRMLVHHANADITIKNKRGKNVLHMAASNPNNSATIKIIMDIVKSRDIKLDVNDLDNSGNTPLHYAVECGSLENVKTLVNDYNCDINRQDKTLQTALHIAAYNGDLNIIKFLVEKDADLELKDEDGVTILRYAQEANHKQVVRYLKDKLNLKLSDDELDSGKEDEDDSSDFSSSDESDLSSSDSE